MKFLSSGFSGRWFTAKKQQWIGFNKKWLFIWRHGFHFRNSPLRRYLGSWKTVVLDLLVYKAETYIILRTSDIAIFFFISSKCFQFSYVMFNSWQIRPLALLNGTWKKFPFVTFEHLYFLLKAFVDINWK